MSARPLSAAHRAHLEASGLRDDIIAVRGYWTASAADADAITRLGHSAALVEGADALMLPVHSVHGDVAMTIIRPDVPQLDAKGRPKKYQAPRGAKLTLDVHPLARAALTDPSVPLWVTEGTKKGDAALSSGAGCVIVLHGVWGWKKHAIPAWDAVHLRDRVVYLAFDSDAATNEKVQLALRRLKGFLGSRGADVRIVHLQPGAEGRKIGLDDALVAGATLAQLAATSTDHLHVPVPADDTRPELDVSTVHRGVVLTAFTHLAAAGLYRTPAGVAVIRSGDGGPRLYLLSAPEMRGVLDRVVRCTRGGDNGRAPTLPPRDLAEQLVHDLEPAAPPLRGLVTAPTFTADGRYLDQPGYDARSGLFLAFGDFVPPAVPDNPTTEQLAMARRLWDVELLGDFPFASDADRTGALALALTPLVRELIDGCRPLFNIDASTRGAGKGKLATACLTPTLGPGGWTVTPFPRDDEEVRKKLLAILLGQPQAVLFDNVRGYVDSASLNLALTTGWLDDRLLGVSKNARAPVRCTWVMTSNNAVLGDDTARRVIPIRLEPQTDRPEFRTDFRHRRLERWVLAHRQLLFWALTVFVRHWLARGRPKPSVEPLGSFESWTTVVGGILESADYGDFLMNREAVLAASDPDSTRWMTFVEAWYEKHHETLISISHLLPLAEEHEIHVAGETDRARTVSLGKAVGNRRDRFFGPYQIRQGTGRNRRMWWILRPVTRGARCDRSVPGSLHVRARAPAPGRSPDLDPSHLAPSVTQPASAPDNADETPF